MRGVRQHLKKKFLLLVMGVLLIPAFLGLPESSAQTEEPVYPTFFGVVDGYWRPEAAAELGVSWERITFDWAQIQPNGPSNFDLSSVREEWLLRARDSNREVVGMIINTPLWASTNSAHTGTPVGLYRPFDSPENQWAVFLRQVVTWGSPFGISRWIIWNTPDIQPGDAGLSPSFEGSVDDFYRLVSVAYRAIKAVDADADVLIGGLVWWNDIYAGRELFLRRFLQAAQNDPGAAESGYFFDGVTLNITLSPQLPLGLGITSDAAGDIVTTVRLILEEVGLADKQIWINELNASPTLDPIGGLPNAPINFTPAQQADFIVQGVALAMAAAADRVAVYKLFDANFENGTTLPLGLLRFDNSRRPAFDAYAFAIATFAPSLKAIAGRSQNARLVILEQADRTVYVMWSADRQAVDFWVERQFGDTPLVYDVYGNALPEPRQSIGTENRDVFVVETAASSAAETDVVRVSGSPVILIMQGAPRAVWAAIEANAVRLY